MIFLDGSSQFLLRADPRQSCFKGAHLPVGLICIPLAAALFVLPVLLLRHTLRLYKAHQPIGNKTRTAETKREDKKKKLVYIEIPEVPTTEDEFKRSLVAFFLDRTSYTIVIIITLFPMYLFFLFLSLTMILPDLPSSRHFPSPH